MEPRLFQSQTQKLVLSPLIRQYLKLLQLPLSELRSAIEQELAENSALEEVAKDNLEETAHSKLDEEKEGDNRAAEELRFDETLRSLDKIDDALAQELYSQEDLSRPDPQLVSRHQDYKESLITRKESLFEYLLWQVNFLNLTDSEKEIAEEIIGNLTEEGYFSASVEEIAGSLKTTPEEVEKVLKEIQGLDPPGIAASNFQETLLLQLARKGEEAKLAREIVQNHLPLLEKKQWDQIAKQSGASPEAIRQAAQLIARLDPKPGRTFYSEDPIAVTPDASVSFDESGKEKLLVEMYDDEIPEIRISPYYRKMLRTGKLDETSRRFLKEKIQSAMNFLKALGQRQSTLHRITQEIVRAQPEFFTKGFSRLAPLRLKDIADGLGIHESTVSRAIQGKYISTPQGTLPYKSFFSSRLERTEGGAESQKSTMENIRRMIREEDPQKPLSDEALTKVLQEQGIKIARRTVAKYRELLKILPTHLRKSK